MSTKYKLINKVETEFIGKMQGWLRKLRVGPETRKQGGGLFQEPCCHLSPFRSYIGFP